MRTRIDARGCMYVCTYVCMHARLKKTRTKGGAGGDGNGGRGDYSRWEQVWDAYEKIVVAIWCAHHVG